MEVELYTIKQAATLINGLSEHAIRRMIKEGALRTIKVGNRQLVLKEDLYELVVGKNKYKSC